MALQHRPFASSIFALAAVCFLWPQPVLAQLQPQNEKSKASKESFVVRVYDVTDLVVSAPDYRYAPAADKRLDLSAARMGGFGGMGGEGAAGGLGLSLSENGNSTSSASITITDLLKTILNVCSEHSWSEVGGEGEVESLGHSLVVSQTAEVHQQIADLLDQLREGSGKRQTVTVDARWLLLNSDELEQLTTADASDQSSLNRAVLAELTRLPTSIRGITNCFSGQLVYLVSGTRQNIVNSVIPVVGSLAPSRRMTDSLAGRRSAGPGNAGSPFMFAAQFGGGGQGGIGGQGGFGGAGGLGGVAGPMMFGNDASVGYQPVVEKSNWGALLEIRPTLIPGGESAIIDLRSTITAPGKSVVPELTQPSSTPQVDRVAIDTQELATTLNVPLGRPVLVGGMTSLHSVTVSSMSNESNEPSSAPADQQESRQLYLIIEVRPGNSTPAHTTGS